MTYILHTVKQKGMMFGFRKTATAVTRPEIYIYIYIRKCVNTAFFMTTKSTL